MNHDRARKYNLSRDLDAPTLARLSAAVGRDVSGWTDADLEAVAAWQRAQGLTPDGMVGPRTVAALPVAVAAEGAPLIAVSPAAGGGGYDHAHDPSDPSRGGWPKQDPQWEAATATSSWLAGMLRLLTGRQERGGRVTYSRGPDDFISLDTYSVGVAHWWAGTAPSKLFAPLASRFSLEADAAWGAEGADILRDPREMLRRTGDKRGHMRFHPGLRWLLDGWWAVARRPHWLAAQVEVWASDYIGEALDVARGAGVRWGELAGADRGRVLAAIARMCNSSPAMARAVVRRFWGGRGDLVRALREGYAVERTAGGYSKGGNGPRRWAQIEAMCAVEPAAAVFDGRWGEAVSTGIYTNAAPERARGV